MNSNRKGKVGEREFAKKLQEIGCEQAHRGQQYQGSPKSPDVANGIPGTHPEIKRVERLNIHDAINQAIADSGPSDVPYVAHRRNHGDWLVTLRFDDLIRFCECVAAINGKPIYPRKNGTSDLP